MRVPSFRMLVRCGGTYSTRMLSELNARGKGFIGVAVWQQDRRFGLRAMPGMRDAVNGAYRARVAFDGC